MPAIKVNLTIEQGATYDKSWTWKVGKPLLPVDMTSYTGHMQIRPTIDSPTILLDLSTGAGLTLGSDGVVRIFIDAVTTAALSFTKAYYDLEVSSGGVVRRLMQGTVTLAPNVTR